MPFVATRGVFELDGRIIPATGGSEYLAPIEDDGPSIEELVDDNTQVLENKMIKLVDQPSALEIAKHNELHLEFRSWCKHCVSGKLKEDQHRRLRESDEAKEEKKPVLQMDYCFMTDPDMSWLWRWMMITSRSCAF